MENQNEVNGPSCGKSGEKFGVRAYGDLLIPETIEVATSVMVKEKRRVLIESLDVELLGEIRNRLIRHLIQMLRVVMVDELILENGSELDFRVGQDPISEFVSYDAVFQF